MAPENLDRLASPEEPLELFRPKYWSEEIDLAVPNLWDASAELGLVHTREWHIDEIITCSATMTCMYMYM